MVLNAFSLLSGYRDALEFPLFSAFEPGAYLDTHATHLHRWHTDASAKNAQ
jgi:hypothetical protein